MRRLLRTLPALLLVAACSDAPQDVLVPTAERENALTTPFEQAIGMSQAQLAALPQPTRRVGFTPMKVSVGSEVLDFEDLDHGPAYHCMIEHSPYHEGVYSGPCVFGGIQHYNNVAYGRPTSGTHFLFNGWGQDGESITLLAPKVFKGAYVANPHWYSPPFQFDLYLGGSLVASSSSVTLNQAMQWVASGYAGAVDHIVMRIPQNTWWVMDDMTFGPADPQTKDDCKNGGWELYGFQNQGQCVRFVETGKDSR